MRNETDPNGDLNWKLLKILRDNEPHRNHARNQAAQRASADLQKKIRDFVWQLVLQIELNPNFKISKVLTRFLHHPSKVSGSTLLALAWAVNERVQSLQVLPVDQRDIRHKRKNRKKIPLDITEITIKELTKLSWKQ